MLNYLWLALVLLAAIIGAATGRIAEVTAGAFQMADTAVMKIALPLVGIMALWLGWRPIGRDVGKWMLAGVAIFGAATRPRRSIEASNCNLVDRARPRASRHCARSGRSSVCR